MTPINLRQVPLALQYRPVYVPQYVPPRVQLEGPSKLGQVDLGAALGQLPQSILVGGIGAAAVYVGEILPSPLDIVAKVGGVSAVGFALYQLLGAKPTRGTPARTNVDPEKAVPSGALPFKPDELQVELDKAQTGQGGLTRSGIAPYIPIIGKYQGFDFIIRNFTNKPRQLFAGLRITDSDGHLIWRSYSTNQPWFGRQFYEVPADLVGEKNYVQGTRWTDAVFYAKEVFVQIELFRTAQDEKSFKDSEPLEIIFWVFGS